MKTTISLRLLLASLLGFAAAGQGLAAERAKSTANIDVQFSHPEKFTDVKDSDQDTDNERGGANFLPQIKEHIEQQAAALLPAGQKLTVTFSDIDLAGDFEPWRGPQFNDVRIVKSIYVPRLNFSFTLTDSNGKVLKEGERKLVDLAYQMRITRSFQDDPLRYEKDMLSDWLRQEFPRQQS